MGNMRRPGMGRPGGGPPMPHEKVKVKNAKGTLKRLISYMNSYKIKLLLAFVLSAVVSVITISTTRLNGIAIDECIASFNLKSLGVLCIIILLLHLISGISTYFIHSNMIKVSQNTSATIRKDLFSAIQKLPIKYPFKKIIIMNTK